MKSFIYSCVISIFFILIVSAASHSVYATDEYMLVFSFRSIDNSVQLESIRLLPGIAPQHFEQSESNPTLNIIGSNKNILYEMKIEIPFSGDFAANSSGTFFSVSIPYISDMVRYEIVDIRNITILSGSIPTESQLIEQLISLPASTDTFQKLDLSKQPSEQKNQKTETVQKLVAEGVQNKAPIIAFAVLGFCILGIAITLFIWRRNRNE